MTTILVVDDDDSLCRALKKGLRAHGYDVVTALSALDGIALASKTYPELLLVDLGLPQLSSVEVITAVRGWSSAPIIVLSARHSEALKLAALDAGSDDFLAKPFGINELLARIHAALRRRPVKGTESVVVAGALSIDLEARRVDRSGDYIDLTPKEWGALALLVRHQGAFVLPSTLLEQLWGPGYHEESAYLRTVVARLSQKLEGDASKLSPITETDAGYRFQYA